MKKTTESTGEKIGNNISDEITSKRRYLVIPTYSLIQLKVD